jgi:hypothetical protein
MVIEENIERLLDLIRTTSGVVRRGYQEVDRADLDQIGWVWVYERPNKVAEYLNLDLKEGDKLIAFSLRNAMVKFARKERAHIRGYEVEDEYYYSTDQLVQLLPVVLAGMPWPEPEYKIRSNADPAEGGNRAAIEADISQAYGWLHEDQRRILDRAYGESASGVDATTAGELGLTIEAWQMQKLRAIRALQAKLGGPRPWADLPDQQRVGTRKVVTNAAAQSMTRRQLNED